jgi:hypothetical protein
MTGEELTDEVLMSLFEAARWAPLSLKSNSGVPMVNTCTLV